MHTRREQFSTTLAFAASANKSLSIGNVGFWVTGMLIQYQLVYDTGTAFTPMQDTLYRGITALTINAEGKPVISVGTPDARTLYWAGRFLTNGGGRVQDVAGATSGAALALNHTLILPFGTTPTRADGSINWYDTSAAIRPTSDLTLNVTWAAAGSTTTTTVWGINVGVETTTALLVTLFGVVPESAQEAPKYRPSWVSSQFAPSQTYSGLSARVTLDTPMFYRKTVCMALSGASPVDNRLDSLGTTTAAAFQEFGIRRGGDNAFVVNLKYVDFAQSSQAGWTSVGDDNQANAQGGQQGTTLTKGSANAGSPWNPGVGIIDWAQIGAPGQVNPMYGIDNRAALTGAATIQLTVGYATNTTFNMLHLGYLPYTN